MIIFRERNYSPFPLVGFITVEIKIVEWTTVWQQVFNKGNQQKLELPPFMLKYTTFIVTVYAVQNLHAW